MRSISASNPPLRLAPVRQIPLLPDYGWTTPSALRHLIHNAEDRVASNGTIIPGNGLAPAILRIGRRVLIDLDAFDAWLDKHRASGSEE